jgi:ketosteroid isomerase-like protein
VHEFVDGDDVVCAIGRYGGKAAASGNRFDIEFVHVLRFGPHGRITRYQEYSDTYTSRQVLGR